MPGPDHGHPVTSPNTGNLSAPRVAAIAVTVKGDAVILVQRRKEPQRLGWGFPGGAINPGESIRDAALRELREETTLEATAGEILDVVEVNEHGSDGRHYHAILIAVLCQYRSGDPVAGDDAKDCRWMSFSQIARNRNTLIPHVADVAAKAALALQSEKR